MFLLFWLFHAKPLKKFVYVNIVELKRGTRLILFFITYIPRIFLVALLVGGNKIRPDRIRPELSQFGPDFNKTIMSNEFWAQVRAWH